MHTGCSGLEGLVPLCDATGIQLCVIRELTYWIHSTGCYKLSVGWRAVNRKGLDAKVKVGNC